MRRRSVWEKARHKQSRRRCRKCKGKEFVTKVYDDAYIHICQRCHFPVRVLR